MTPGTYPFGADAQGREVQRVVISRGGLSAAILTQGAILQDVRLAGVSHGLALGFPELAPYLGAMASCGALMGPVVNRISNGTAPLAETVVTLEKNQDGRHTRHSGSAGTHRKLWEIDIAGPAGATLTLSLPDGEGGFPGNRAVSADFRLLRDATLELRVTMTTDADTLVNFANHGYWNLDGSGTFAGHRLTVAADRYCVTGPGSLPTGEIREVAGTPFDFRHGRELSPGRDPAYDHNLCLAQTRRRIAPALTLTGRSGISLAIATTEPGMQVYDGAGFDPKGAVGNDGRRYGRHAGLALEPQGWPDAPNHRGFPHIVLRAGRAYEQVTRFSFSR